MYFKNVFENFIGDNKVIDCIHLNNKCMQDCYCELNNENNVVKNVGCNELFNWERTVYTELLKYNIFPKVDFCLNNKIIYKINKMKSLRKYLKSKTNISILINELFSFIKSLNELGYCHGNLHIDNMMITKNEGKFEFRLIDYINSYLFYLEIQEVNHDRTSFLGEYRKKNVYINYWDMFTMYISLKILFKKNNNHMYLFILEQVVISFIPQKIFKELLLWDKLKVNYNKIDLSD